MTDTTQHDPSKPIACAFCGAISMTVPIKPTHTQELQKQLRELDDEGYQPSTGAIGNKTADALAFHEKELARLRERDLAQQARIAGLRGALERTLPRLHGELYLDHPEVKDIEEALATTDDLSALKAHDDALWNEALTTGIEWQATRGHTLDADDYGNELRSLKR